MIAFGALQCLGHRLDLGDLGKPRLRRRPPVGRQPGRQIGGGRLGRPLGAERVVVGVGIAAPGLQGVLQAVETLGWGNRLAQAGLGRLARLALALEVGLRGPDIVGRPAQVSEQRLRESDRGGDGVRPRKPDCDRRHLDKDVIALRPPFRQVGARGLRPGQQRLAVAEHGASRAARRNATCWPTGSPSSVARRAAASSAIGACLASVASAALRLLGGGRHARHGVRR